jgi:hypothetical protein
VIDEGAVSVDLAAPILLEIGGRLAATARWNAFLIGKTPQETIRTELIECFKMQLARSFSDDESAACRWLEELAVATRG